MLIINNFRLIVNRVGHRFVGDSFPDFSDPRTPIINDGPLMIPAHMWLWGHFKMVRAMHQEMISDVIAHLPHQMGGPWRQWRLSGGIWRQWRSRSGSWRQQPFKTSSPGEPSLSLYVTSPSLTVLTSALSLWRHTLCRGNVCGYMLLSYCSQWPISCSWRVRKTIIWRQILSLEKALEQIWCCTFCNVSLPTCNSGPSHCVYFYFPDLTQQNQFCTVTMKTPSTLQMRSLPKYLWPISI